MGGQALACPPLFLGKERKCKIQNPAARLKAELRRGVGCGECFADWKSAIRQTGSLRYNASRGLKDRTGVEEIASTRTSAYSGSANVSKRQRTGALQDAPRDSADTDDVEPSLPTKIKDSGGMA